MATTEATPAKADPLDQLREARAALDHERAERPQLCERRDQYAHKIRNAQAELDALAHNAPAEFGDEGTPLKGTRALKLRQTIDQAQQSRWPVVIEGADQRVEAAERMVRELTKRYCVPLARAKHDEGAEAVLRARGLTGELRRALAQVRAPEADLLAVAAATAGPFNGTSVWSDGRLADIERALDAIDDLLPARIPAMTRYIGEDEPRAYLTTSGEWVPARSANSVELAEQPAPIERP